MNYLFMNRARLVDVVKAGSRLGHSAHEMIDFSVLGEVSSVELPPGHTEGRKKRKVYGLLKKGQATQKDINSKRRAR